MKIIFMGTPDFAVPSLEILLENGYDVVGVITATDKFGGRGNKTLIESDVKKFALQKGLNILQPKNLKNKDFLEELKSLNADLQIVVAFRMLPEVVWNMPSLGTMNLHGSLLPKYRGAAPINWAIINGEKETGVTTFLLKHEIDTGDILFQAKTDIGNNETTGELYNRLKKIGSKLLLKSVRTLESGNYKTEQQDIRQVSHAPKIFHKDCLISFNRSCKEVHNFIRGMSPYPTAWTIIECEKLKIFRSEIEIIPHSHENGTIISDGKKFMKIAVKDGYIHLKNLQLTKRKRMDISSFMNGYNLNVKKIG